MFPGAPVIKAWFCCLRVDAANSQSFPPGLPPKEVNPAHNAHVGEAFGCGRYTEGAAGSPSSMRWR